MTDSLKTNSGFVSYDVWRAAQNFDEQEIAEGVKQIYREVLEYKLRELRQHQGLTQQQLADKLGLTQNRISKFERLDLDRSELQTIRRYLEALGGELSLVVDIEGVQHKIELNNKSKGSFS
ncbi:MAG: helix-turn-helix domain-containing protein [Rhodoluna sp.]